MSLRDMTGQRILLSKNMPHNIHISSVLLPAFFPKVGFPEDSASFMGMI